jgi:hypothetical protein
LTSFTRLETIKIPYYIYFILYTLYTSTTKTAENPCKIKLSNRMKLPSKSLIQALQTLYFPKLPPIVTCGHGFQLLCRGSSGSLCAKDLPWAVCSDVSSKPAKISIVLGFESICASLRKLSEFGGVVSSGGKATGDPMPKVARPRLKGCKTQRRNKATGDPGSQDQRTQ